MPARSSLGAVVAVTAILVVGATAGAYYYTQSQQASSSETLYLSELTSATSRYDSLASSYNASLTLYNQTFSLLAGAIGQVNTSLPIYQQASKELSQLWSRYLGLKPAPNLLYSANVLIDFGNGTRYWFNDTRVQPGWDMYTETVILTHGNLQAQWYPEYGEHLVLGIDGVSTSSTMSWFLWSYNRTASWQKTDVGADLLPVVNGSTLAWTYCGEAPPPSFAPTCTP